VSPEQQDEAYPLSRCITCGCCLEACPQYSKIEVWRHAGESDADYAARKAAEHEGAFVGAAVISQAILFNSHPTGAMLARERLEALMSPGGITDCGNAQNCVKVCPKEIPLLRSLAQAGRQATIHAIKRWLSR
jgi:succinate dehydrogenase / fumarate reductase iron-sulfur subunit